MQGFEPEGGAPSPRKLPPLPIDDLLPKLAAAVHEHRSVVLEAAPGAGKTTRVPSLLMNVVEGEILVVEPRRMAARMAARRVAWELGEKPGETVGYQVRFEDVSSAKTRIRLVTDGVLGRRMTSDPELRGVSAVVLDEFHERHLESDVSLALLRRLQERGRDLRLVVMSATLATQGVASYLGGCPVLHSTGREFPISVRHTPYSPQPLDAQVQDAVRMLLREGERGHVLVFLPGAAEIRRAMRACEPLREQHGLLLLPLHGDLSPAEQDMAVAPSTQQKVIFSTNIAESSLTIDGVTAVVDSGLARVAGHSPWTGFAQLEVKRISKASARQRAGRAGRTAPGRVVRLYSEADFALRAEFDAPEILRSDLSQMCLALRAMGIDHPSRLAWLDAPPESALSQAESLLDELGATGAAAKELARYPLPPRLGRVMVEGIRRGAGETACTAIALLSSGARLGSVDLEAALEASSAGEMSRHAKQHLQQLRRIANRPRDTARNRDEALLLSVLAGFPDHVARRRADRQIALANGASAEVDGERPPYEFMVALDAEERSDRAQPLVRLTSRVEPEWLIDLFPHRVTERTQLVWNRYAERIESVTEMRYGELLLQDWRDPQPRGEAVEQMLAAMARDAGAGMFVNREDLQMLEQRIAFAGLGDPAELVSDVLVELCTGLNSFADLRALASERLLELVESRAGGGRLRELAPLSIVLKAGRKVKVHYEPGRPPWIESRLQDFFGMSETPRIGADRSPLVVHLLAPNGRAVQTTTDLAGFWSRLYPQVRKELMRRYPRHQWPEQV